ncbi:potassium channel family protein [Methylotuvimicrobium alcaliphilum]|uniref:TrkA-N domain protein n=1 Tax=Methylotuvimicrobium alcaliphilum (strain DSM 19304 / NCIMB 14124 / VKM B-2133 / 20Z) TaxID=1091494 RepID=G4SXP8_META2|nr:NAD-binding protein [Methylotuvimicrobium alcaliphilum]CCE22103.1 putative TrkA-N domain protein [Methylotuvimicrobium alcaliphilum 20Z]
MAESIDLSRVSFIVMREMRRPVMALITVYAVSILGMVFIPGHEVDGKPQYLSVFHAFYFMTYTATTTGFGEIPFEFNDAQRLWAMACLYVSVITWFYAIGSIVRLFQNPFFVRAVEERKFSRQVLRISEPYFIICGFGDTGSVLARGLSDYGVPAVFIDGDEDRIRALTLRDYRVPMPGLCADASVPKHLLEAGIRRRNCQAIVAITNNEEINLKISALARLLNPSIRIITLSKVDVFEETLANLGGEVHIVDPFKMFAKVLVTTMTHPSFYPLNNWLVRAPRVRLSDAIKPPFGKWIVCGYGRMGHEINHALVKQGMKTVVIDPHDCSEEEGIDSYIVGRSTAKTLAQAGIENAVGILAGTDDDGHNLGILLNARKLNGNLFTLVRQNRHENRIAFEASQIDMIMQPTLVTARRVLFLLVAPLLKPFFQHLLKDEPGRKEDMEKVVQQLEKKIGRRQPHLITVDVVKERCSAVTACLEEGEQVLLGDLLKHPDNFNRKLDLIAFVVKSGEVISVLPPDDYRIKIGDQILFCGTGASRRLLNATLNNEYNLFYVRNGVHLPKGYFMRWYAQRQNRPVA